jgi:hypothetical protein
MYTLSFVASDDLRALIYVCDQTEASGWILQSAFEDANHFVIHA